jgi:hypothetical protein
VRRLQLAEGRRRRGRLAVGTMTVLAMARPRVRRAAAADGTIPGKPFTVAHFIRWARECTLDNGKPWRVEKFQADFIADVFNGIPECWLVLPEENGKTTLIAGLALYVAEHKSDPSIPVAASSRDQGRRIYDQGSGFVRRTPRLRARFRCYIGYRAIDKRDAGQKTSEMHNIEIFAADEGTGDGAIPDLAIVEELHRHKSFGLYRTWRGKLDKRDGQLVAISTGGEAGGEFETVRQEFRLKATEVIRGDGVTIYRSSDFVLHDWAVPEGGDVEDMVQVKKSNPLSTITIAKLARKRRSPAMTLQHWSRMVCNRPTRAVNAAITEAEWASAETKAQIPQGVPVMLGLDTAWKFDTTAIVPLWVRDPQFRQLGPATILVPPRDGNSLDHHRIESALVAIAQRNPVSVVVMDVSFGLEQLAEWIEQNLHTKVIRRAQTDPFQVVDYEAFMEGLRLGWLHHSGDPGLTRHVLNAIAQMLPSGRSRFVRLKQGRESHQEERVIDALVAAAMVHAEYAHPAAEKKTTMRWGAA